MERGAKAEKVMELAQRRGFFWPSTELYGGVGGFLDFGPLGAVLKRKVEEKWRRWFVHRHQDLIVEIETPVVMIGRVFEASGHVEHFTDYVVDCTECRRKYRADHMVEEATGLRGLERLSPRELSQLIEERGVKCPECGGRLSEVKTFNLLFRTFIGPYTENVAYARPEAAQGMFVNFARVFRLMRGKLPLGIAQVGKVLRNEVSPRQGPIRLREFTIMELELFFNPEAPSCPFISAVEDVELPLLTEEDVEAGRKSPRRVKVREAVEEGLIKTEWNAYFMALSKSFLESLGVPSERQMFVAKLPGERAHYAVQVYDQLVNLERWGWVEVSGHAYRTDYDLKRHMEASGQDLSVYYGPGGLESRRLALKPVIEAIKESFGSEASRVLKELSSLSPERAYADLRSKGYVEVAGLKLTSSHLLVREEVEKASKCVVPHVAEPSFGAERLIYVVMEYAYTERNGRVVLSLPVDLAPIEVVVLPLLSRDGLPELAQRVYRLLADSGLRVDYDESGSIGRRYARADEVGVPVAVTIDYQSLVDGTVTLRNRDTWRQVRASINELPEKLKMYLSGRVAFEELGVSFKKSLS
ncbi:MAG: glycine--tRNA ligase [Candidatus Nezhaarchaeota archaeon]|nr:glycine--tRNA ligase [Candidatus Nezhaarchaeota archaeon]